MDTNTNRKYTNTILGIIMVTTEKTWNFTVSNSIASAVDQVDQYQELFFSMKNLFVSASWTVTMSCGLGGNGSGSVTASTGDNILSKSDVIIGTINTQTSSYYVLVPPNGWLPSGSSQESFQLRIAANSAQGGSTPRVHSVAYTSQQFKLHPTNPIARMPAARYPIGSSIATASTSTNILPTSPTTTKWHGWYTTDGDVMFAVSTGTVITFAFWVCALRQSAGGEGRYRMFIYGPPYAAALSTAQLGQGNNYWGITNDGTPSQGAQGYCHGWDLTSWTNGLSSVSGAPIKTAIHISQQGVAGAYLGRVCDVSGGAGNQASNHTINNDADATVLMSLDSLWIPISSGSLPLTF